MKTKFHPVAALILFAIMFSVASMATTLAQDDGAMADATETCTEKVFEIDRNKIFSDIPIQRWYTHAVNFTRLIHDADLTESGEKLAKFYPLKAVREGEFLAWAISLRGLAPDAEPLQFESDDPTARLTQGDIADIVEMTLGIPRGAVLEIFKKNKIRGKWVLKRDAAFILLKSAEEVLDSPETALCEKWASGDPEEFLQTFGSPDAEMAANPAPQNTPSESPTQATGTPPSTSNTPAGTLTSTSTPSIATLTMNLAPVNPRAGQSVTVTIRPLSKDQKAVTGASLRLAKVAGIDSVTYDTLNETSPGTYEASFVSSWAGTYTLNVVQNNQTLSGGRSITFRPDMPSQMTARIETPQEKSMTKHEAVVAVTLRDKFGNVVSFDQRELRTTTDLGTISKIEKRDQTGLITVSADRWGEANLNISHITRDVQDAATSIKIPFSGIALDIPKGIQTDRTIDVPVYLYLPKSAGKIGGYRFTLQYEKQDLTFKKVAKTDTGDGFDVPKVSGDNGTLVFEQAARGTPASEVLNVGTVTFLASTATASGTIFIPEGRVISEQEKIITLTPSSGASESIGRWWYGVKSSKDVCLDVWLTEGTVNRAEAMGDIQKASNMWQSAADNSLCPYYFNLTINFHTISQADWRARVDTAGGTADVLDNGEEVNLRANFSGNAQCVQVWYVPDMAPLPGGLDPAGLSYPNNGGITIDNHGDGIDHVLGHELNHQLSGNDVLDSPFDPGNSQGALNPKNPMNYNDPGFAITKEQCELLTRQPYVR